LAQSVADDIDRGRFGSDGKLPPMVDVARSHRVSLRTVQAAWNILKDHGLIDSTSRAGGYVVSPPSVGRARSIMLPYPVDDDSDVLTFVSGETFGYRLIDHVRDALRHRGMELIAQPYAPDHPQRTVDLIAAWRRGRTDIAGMIVHGGRVGCCGARFAEAASSVGMPCVSLNAPSPGVQHDFVGADHFQVGALAGRLLSLMGMRDIAFVTEGLYPDMTTLAQYGGLVQSFERAGFDPTDIRMIRTGVLPPRDRVTHPSRLIVRHVLRHGLPQAFVGSDAYLLGILEGLRKLNIDVPGDVPVLGLTGLASLAERVDPPLTTIDTPIDAVARQLVEMLLTKVRTNTSPMPGRLCAPGLTIRQSLVVSADVESQLRLEMRALDRSQPAQRLHGRGG
jgi:DNA-binding LacI/PurR family transcriptional regulator